MTSSSTDEQRQQQQAPQLASLRCAAGTDVGMRREENQDAFGIVKKERFHGYFVADGMGGVRGGAVASRTAIAALDELLRAHPELPSVDALSLLIQGINQRIFDKGSADPALAGMGTTLVGFLLSPSAAYCVNVGDSRAYRVRAGEIVQLSEDHTLVRELVVSGAITPEQAEHHPVAHMLTRSLGTLEEIHPDIISLETIQIGDIYVLCSDGLYNYVDPREIMDVVRQNPLDDASQILINLANQRGGSDNITVVIVAVGDLSSKKRSAQYRHARDIAAQSIQEPSSVEPSGSDYTRHDAPVTQGGAAAQGDAIAQGGGEQGEAPDEEGAQERPILRTELIEPPPVQEPPDLDRVAANRRRKRLGYHRPQRGVPVPLLVVAALVLGMVVGGLARKLVLPRNLQELASLIGGGNRVGVSAPAKSGVDSTKGQAERPARFNQYDKGGEALGVDSTPEKDKMVRDAFESSIHKLESQIAALEQPSGANSEEEVAVARKKAEDIQANLVLIEEQIGAASRKLQQWYARQKRLETQDALKLAAEVGASSESVKKKKADFEAATYDLIRMLDDVEQNHPNDEVKLDQLYVLKERRNRMLRELQADVRDTVDTVLAETNKHVEDLKIQRQLLSLQLETVKQDLEYAKALSKPDLEIRQAMRERLEENLAGLRASLVDLERLMNGEKKSSIQRSGARALGE